jgi:DNA-binding NarL/FixJ family response regulator
MDEHEYPMCIAIFDDHPVLGHGAAELLRRATVWQVLYVENTRDGLLEQLAQRQPDLLLMDVVAPDVNGLDLFKEIRKLHPTVHLVAYTQLKSPILIESLLQIGVRGYVSKLQPAQDLVAAVQAVAAGELSFPPKYLHLTSRYRLPEDHLPSERELEVLRLIAGEATTQEIAQHLQISTKTVENHRASLMRKLDTKNVAGLMLAATRLGYLS